MMSDWPEYQLKDLISIKHGFAYKGEFFSSEPTSEILVTPGNFSIGGGFKEDKFKYYNGPIQESYILKPGDLIVTMTDLSKESDTLGFSALVPDTKGVRYHHNQRIGLVDIKNKDLITKDYLYFLLRTNEYRHEVMASSTGTSVKHTSPTKILNFSFKLPPIEYQNDVAKRLLSFESKISNNTAMNSILEKIAQRIFKSWFVDFDPVKANAEGVTFDGLSPEIQSLFPNEFEESELGMIPKDWSASNIGKEFDVVMGQSPPGSSYNETGEGTLFFQGRRDFGFRYPAERVFTNAPKRLAKAGDTLLSVRAPVGDVNKALRDCCVGRGVGALRHKSGCESFTYYASKRLRNIFDNFDGEGTVFGSINQTELKALKIIAPSNEVMKKFNEIATPLDERIKVNTEQINSLTKIRDKLLPRLISGKITIQKAEELLEEAS